MTPLAKISRVLVGVDFDDASASALKMAGVLASAWNAGLTVFHSAVQEAPVYFTADQFEPLEAEREQNRARTIDQLRALARQHTTGAIEVVVDEEPPADGLLRIGYGFDLIVVGTHRRHGAGRWWLGSIAEAVVRHSSKPVLVVPVGAVIPEADRPATVLLAGGDGAEAAAWLDVLRSTFESFVVHSPDIHHCDPERLQAVDLIVLPLAAGAAGHEQLGLVVQVLKECVHPVLFVPSSDGTFERISS